MDYSDQEQSDNLEPEDAEVKSGIPSVGWKSCFMLAVLIIGILATPITLFYRWSQSRAVSEEVLVQEDIDIAINRIAYVNRDRYLMSINPDGTEQQELVKLDSRLAFPAWSPDGQFIAVASGSELYIVPDSPVDHQGSAIKPVYTDTEQSPFYVYWSPDSKKLSFLANHPEGLALHLHSIESASSESGIVTTGQPFYWDWSLDSSQLLIHTGLLGEDARLALVDNRGRGADIAQPGFFQAPGISNSGRFSAFAERGSSGESHVVIEDFAQKKYLSETVKGKVALLWSPSEDRLAFSGSITTTTGEIGSLRLATPDNSHIDTLSSDEVLAFFWSPNGRKIAYITIAEQDFGSIQAFLDTGNRALRSGNINQTREINLDLWVVDVETKSKRLILKFTPSLTFVQQFLPFFDQYALSHRLWSPDSSAIVMPIINQGISHLAVVPVNRGEITFVSVGEIGFWSHQ